MNNSFDVIIIGIGSMGSSSSYYLARRGYRVLGLEQFGISHEFGSHAGQSRIIRKAYFENSNYVPLLGRAYQNWREFENETGTQLYFPTGLAYFGPRDHQLVKGVTQSASLYNIELDKINGAEVARRFPQFKIPGNFETVFEPDAGFIVPELAIKLYSEQAIKNGAEIHTGETVLDWKKDGESIIVTTDKNNYRCKKLILTAGAWSGKMIPGFSSKIKVTRQFVAWVKPKNWDQFTLSNFPCWLLADDSKKGCYYGFPILPSKFGDPIGLKLARHYSATETDPGFVNRQITDEDKEDLNYVSDNYFHELFESIISYKICLYANSPDEDFIIDKLPGYEDNVIIACGFSGHGFKFVSVVGEILADLAIKNRTDLPIEFLGINRILP